MSRRRRERNVGRAACSRKHPEHRLPPERRFACGGSHPRFPEIKTEPVLRGHPSCFSAGMDHYDVKAEGCHNPLTSQEIAEHIQTGRFQRNDPCRKVGENTWRTIDELFPLLEHGSGNRFELSSAKPEPRPTAIPLGIAAAIAAALLAGGIHFLWLRPAHRAAAKAGLARHSTVVPAAKRGYSYSPTTPRNPGSDRLRSNQERLEAERRQREKLAKEKAARADRTKR